MNKPASRRILVVEDDANLNRLLAGHLSEQGYEVTGVQTGSEARAYLAARTPDLVLLDVRLPDCSGFDLLVEIVPNAAVIIMTAYGAVDQAVRAVRTGASDYLVKPVSYETLGIAIDRIFTTRELRRDIAYWQARVQREDNTTIIGSSPQIETVRKMIDLYSDAGSSVLLDGESGVGKELVARTIHERSARGSARFVSVDCDPTHENLIVQELVGHEKGAVPEDEVAREGMLEFADRGTIYLSDIAETSLSLQSRILRVMETGTFRRFGSASDFQTDVRIIAGTRYDLAELVQQGKFRSELYFRLVPFRLTVPPLRARRGDIPEMARAFLEGRRFQRGTEKALAPATLKLLKSYDWPGNARELRNVIERGVIMSGHEALIEPHHIVLNASDETLHHGENGRLTLRYQHEPTMEELRNSYLKLLLSRHDGNRRKVAEILGISERNTYRLIARISPEPE